MSKQNLEKFVKDRINRKPFATRSSSIPKEKLKSFINQSVCRVNAIVDFHDDKVPEKYYEIITRGVEMILLEQFILDKLAGKVGDDLTMALTFLNHMENVFLQEIQLIREE